MKRLAWLILIVAAVVAVTICLWLRSGPFQDLHGLSRPLRLRCMLIGGAMGCSVLAPVFATFLMIGNVDIFQILRLLLGLEGVGVLLLGFSNAWRRETHSRVATVLLACTGCVLIILARFIHNPLTGGKG